MRILKFNSDQIFQYIFTGKFKAPSKEWKHEKRLLKEYELFVMTEGTLYLKYNNEKFILNKGEYLILPPTNSWREGFQSSYCAFYWLHFTTLSSDDIETVPYSVTKLNKFDSFKIPQIDKIPKPEKVIVLMKQLQDAVKSEYPVFALNAMTTSIITELYAQFSTNEDMKAKTFMQKQIYSDIIDYIQRNISTNIKVSEIAKRFGYNEKYLSHMFSQITGETLKQFILKRKIDAANFLLTDTNKKIVDIAGELGYSDIHNFCKAYKRMTGLTPNEYRNAFGKRMLFHE